MGTTTKEIGGSSFNDMISSVDRRSEYVENRAGANVRLNNFLTPYTLDDKSSILNAPCGYSNGVYASLRPSDALGPELVTNGDFATDSNWNKTNATISNGVATITVTSGGYASINQSITYVSGKKYRITAQIQGLSGSNGRQIRFQDNGSNTGGLTLSNGIVTLDETLQNIEIIWTANSNSNEIEVARNTTGSFNYAFTVNNISIKEDTSADFSFTRGSAATRVTKDGLIKNVQILSDELVQNGDFSQIGSEEVTNGDFSVGGVVNTSSYTLGWYSPDSNINITNNELVITNGASVGGRAYATDGVNSINVVISGKFYKLVYTITENNDNATMLYHTGGAYVSAPNTVGTHTIYYKAAGTIFILRNNTTNTTVKIDNVSVKEIGQNWTFGTGWSVDQANSKAVFDGGADSNLTSSLTVVNGKIYRYNFTVSDMTTGALSLRLGASNVSDLSVTSNGTYEGVTTSEGTQLLFRSNSGFDGSITNISVIEVTDDTDLPRIDYTNGTGSLLLEPQSTNLITYSEDFSQWNIARATLTSEVGQSIISGNTNINKLQDSTDNNTHIVYYAYESFNTSETYTFSAFLKKGSLDYGFLAWENNDARTCIFNLNLGTIHSQGSSILDAEIKLISNNWYKCSITFSNPASSELVRIGTSNGNRIYTGSGNDYIYFDAAQLEELSYATSYIPTSGSTVTRNADVCNNSGSSDLINSTEGVLYAEISALANDGTIRRIALSDETVSQRVLLTFPVNSNRIQVEVINSSNQFFQNYDVSNLLDFNKIAISWKTNDFKLYVNGTLIANDILGNAPIGLSKLSFDNGIGSQNFYGNTKSVAVFKEALTDEELAKITSTTQQEAFYEMRDKMLQIDADYYEFGDYTTRLKKLF